MSNAKLIYCVLAAVSVAAFGCADPEPSASAQATASLTVPVPTLGQYVVLAGRSASVGDRSRLLGGDVGVRPSTGAVPNSFTGGSDSRVGIGEVLLAQRVVLRDRAIAGEIGANLIEAPFAVTGPRSPFVAPPAPPVPGTFTAGTASVTVNSGQTSALAAGRFGAVTVNGILNLNGGLYEIQSLRLNPDARVVALARSTVNVTGGIAAADRSRLVAPAPQPASNLRLVVNGTIDSPTNSFTLGTDAQLRAIVIARNVFRAADRLIGSGAIAAQDVIIANDSQLAFDSGFGCSSNVDCNDNNPCTVDTCSAAACVSAPAANGAACNDGNACTQADTCQAGVCTGANPVVCAASDQCHDPGTCNPANGVCSSPARPNGSACSDGSACTQVDTCQAGACTGANPVLCAASDQCHDPGTCNPANGVCSSPAKPDGSACSDASACTQMDACQAGVCTGANPVVCAASDQCHDPGACDPASGVCSNPARPDGSACSDGNACTQTDACQAGVCAGASPVVCAGDQCRDPGTCDPASGVCSNPARPDGSACSDGNACTQMDACQAGACAGASPVVCSAADQCHDPGACDPASGVCSNPAKPDGATCDDGDACSIGDACEAGACSPGTDFRVTEFATGLTQPGSILSGPNGRLWFVSRETAAEGFNGSIASITTAGAVAASNVFPRDPYALHHGPDGLLWVAERFLGGLPAVARYDASSGTFVSDYFLGVQAHDIASTNDAGTPVIWLTAGASVVRVNPSGMILSTTPTRNVARAITTAAPTATTTVWITQASSGGVAYIGRIQFPTLSHFPINTPGELADLAEGSDGGIWFTDAGRNEIGRLAPSGSPLVQYPLPTPASGPHGITAGPDDNLWFALRDANKIGRITTTGEIMEVCIPTPGSAPTDVTAGPDGNIWFTESASGKIGRVELPPLIAAADSTDAESEAVAEEAEEPSPAAGESGCSVATGRGSNSGALGWLLALGALFGARRRTACGSGRPANT